RAGKASSASKASVRRRPWPSFWWRSPAGAAGAVARRSSSTSTLRLALATFGFFAETVVCICFSALPWVRDRTGRDSMSRYLSAAARQLLSGNCDRVLGASAVAQRTADATQRLVASEQRDALEDPRRDRAPRDRHAQRLVDLARLDCPALDHAGERLPDARLVEARRLGERGA